jgi:AAA15 family ATPase/GTPase
MLIRFVVSNFLSFGEEREFNMLSGSFKTHKHHIYTAGRVSVLKSAAIYGANGAGKSTLVKAIDFLKDVVDEGQVTKSVNDKKFRLNKNNSTKPINFEIEFSIGNKVYAYGLSLNNSAVVEEWLYESGITVDDKLVFERKQLKSGRSSIKLADKYSKTQKQKYLVELMEESLLKPSELLLGKNDSLKIPEVRKAKEWIDYNLYIIYPGSKFGSLVTALATSDKFNVFANNLLETFDTGVKKLGINTTDFEKFFGEYDEDTKSEILEMVDEKRSVIFRSKDKGSVWVAKEKDKIVAKTVVALHNDNNGATVEFELDDESDGTQRLLDFIPAFEMILDSDKTFVIDEIDQSLHPVLLRSLINKIMSDDTTKGQLIFTTHESSLLDLNMFRQDEIWFAEKDKKKGSTELYSLSDYKPRYDLDIRKGYLQGRFGAIPFLASLQDLNWNSDAQEEGI